MGFPVYSERFILTSEHGSWVHYIVPANKRAIITSVVGLASPGVGAEIQLAVHDVQLWKVQFPGSVTGVAQELRLVAYEYEWIQALLTTVGQTCAVCGYLLDDHTPDPHPPEAAGVLPVPPIPVGPT